MPLQAMLLKLKVKDEQLQMSTFIHLMKERNNRIDGLGRNNSGIAIGDTISVKKLKQLRLKKL